MRKAYRALSAKRFLIGSATSAKTQKAREKVERLLEFLLGVQSSDDLARELANGVTFDWKGLRKIARCGSDAIHKNNPELFAKVEAEKSRIGKISNENAYGRPSEIHEDATLAELRAEVRQLKRTVKNKDQELNGAHLTNLKLLARIERLERELVQEKRSPRPT